MDIQRRTVIAGVGALLTAAGSVAGSSAAGAKPETPYATFLGEGRKSVKVVKILSGADGHARFEDTIIEPQQLGPAGGLTQFLDRQAHAYAVFRSPPNHVIPERLVLPYASELFYLIAGNATVTTRSGSRDMESGTMMLFEDSKGSGHSIKAGADGYFALKLLLANR